MHTHQTSSEATAKTVFSLYGDDRNIGTRQTPNFSSATAEIYHCRILAEVQLAHDRGLYTLQNQIHHRRTTPHRSTQLLDSSHCDELQARPPTIERPFQFYLAHRTTLSKRRPSNGIPSAAPNRRKTARSHQSPSKRPHATLQMNVTSLHTLSTLTKLLIDVNCST